MLHLNTLIQASFIINRFTYPFGGPPIQYFSVLQASQDLSRTHPCNARVVLVRFFLTPKFGIPLTKAMKGGKGRDWKGR